MGYGWRVCYPHDSRTLQCMRISRWTPQKKLINGKPKPFDFVPTDYDICKLFAHSASIRHPWSYRYLPTSYILQLLSRGPKRGGKRLAELYEEGYLAHPPQPQDNARQIIYSVGVKGIATLRDGGCSVGSPKSGRLPHDLKACLIAASFEHGARLHGLPITPNIKCPDKLFPDWPPFLLQGHEIYIEADMGTETIKRSRNKDATTVGQKYEEYLSHIDSRRLKDPLIFFVTKDSDDDQRMENMIEELKAVIDDYRYPYAYAKHFCFAYLGPDRYINKIPKLSDWAITHQWRRAGTLQPFTFSAHGTLNDAPERR